MSLLEIKNIKHMVFDAYGTLFDVHSATIRHQGKLLDKASDVSDLWRRKQLEYTWLRSLMGNYVDFNQVTIEALDFAFDSNGIFDNDLKKELLSSYRNLACYPEVPKFLKTLKKQGFSISVLSNGTFKMLKAAIKNSNLEKYFNAVLSVDNIKVFKPDPKVYKYSIEKLECKPNEILFFSSNSWDISGASSFGYKTVWLNRFEQKNERLPGKPLLEIKNFKDVLKYF